MKDVEEDDKGDDSEIDNDQAGTYYHVHQTGEEKELRERYDFKWSGRCTCTANWINLKQNRYK